MATAATFTAVQDFLQELADAKGATYTAINRHTLEGGRVFYSASAHRGWHAQSKNAATVEAAVANLLACDDWHDATPAHEAA